MLACSLFLNWFSHPLLPQTCTCLCAPAGPLRPHHRVAPNMQDLDTCVSAKAQCLPAESSVDEFLRHLDAGWARWRKRQRGAAQQQQHTQPEGAQQDAAGGAEAGLQQQQGEEQPQPQPQQQLEDGQQQPPPLLFLGRYQDAQAWLVAEVLPGLQRHPHLAGLLALLHKWTSRDVVGVSHAATGEGCHCAALLGWLQLMCC